MNDRRLWAAMGILVVAIWLVGAAVTRYSLEQMAYYTPIAVVVVGGDRGTRGAAGEGRRRRLAPAQARVALLTASDGLRTVTVRDESLDDCTVDAASRRSRPRSG